MYDSTTAVACGAQRPTAAGLDVAFAVEGPHLVASLSGDVDLVNVEALPAVLAGAVSGDESLRIDIGAVTFLDSSLMRALLISESQLTATGVDVKVRHATPQAQRVFELTGLTSLLE